MQLGRRAALAAAAILLGGLAFAHPSFAQCGGGGGPSVRLFHDSNLTGIEYDVTGNIADYSKDNYPGTSANLNDSVSSIENDTNQWYAFYRNANYDGQVLCVGPGGIAWRLGDYMFNTICGSPCGTMNDRLSSQKNLGGAPPKGLCNWTVTK